MKNAVMKATLSAMLVCSPFVVGTAAYADGTDEVKTEQTKQPSLVQGDFFYFVKTMVEKIKLALADNDLEKAKLLSTFAAERMAEAQVLLKEGKEDLLKETLNAAVSNLDKADDIVEKSETEQVEVENVDADTEQVEAEDTAADTEKAETEEVSKVKMHIGHNIEALAKVLDKVEHKNAKAKYAIAKNIEKSFAKIAQRIEKIEMKQQETADMEQEGTLQVVEGQPSEVTEVQPVQESEAEKDSVTVKNQVKEHVALHNEQKDAHKEMKQQEKTERKETHKYHKEMQENQTEEKKSAKHSEKKSEEKHDR
ncbi:DUF5667 domain-containing protein [Bacillus sp. 165]|uniref:DUF5667 domain-containing protein n=1 Tax=Bacillus sp. 165 TaxID=1529117 RepID=UPI001ADB061E|nr:DUF5667 domain-containing protein [Bacillus sp. 165]MBO9129740.1 hypothetical protein [Bacillus sp. 165]